MLVVSAGYLCLGIATYLGFVLGFASVDGPGHTRCHTQDMDDTERHHCI